MKKIKYIYLDQNKWIELAKGLKEKKTEYVALKNKIDKKIKLEEWAFPISIIHLAETMKRNDEASRNDILNLMYDMSKGYAICDYGDADNIEFQYWVENMSMSYKNILPSIITNDYAKIIGISNKSILKNAIDDLNFPVDELKIQFVNDFMNKFKCHRFIFDYIANQSVDMSKDEIFYHNQYLKAKNKFDK